MTRAGMLERLRCLRAGRSPLALAVLAAFALVRAREAQAAEACGAAFRQGPFVWYAVEPLPPDLLSSASACGDAGPDAQVRSFIRGERAVTYCEVEIAPPAAMMAEFEAARLEGAAALPTRRRSADQIWATLTRRHSAELVCPPGFARLGAATAGLPAVWCRKAMSAHQLCPAPGSVFLGGACVSSACPVGTMDLAPVTRGKLQGCFRCPAGRLDLAQSVAWQGERAPSAEHRPETEVLCRARASDPCPAAGSPGPR